MGDFAQLPVNRHQRLAHRRSEVSMGDFAQLPVNDVMESKNVK